MRHDPSSDGGRMYGSVPLDARSCILGQIRMHHHMMSGSYALTLHTYVTGKAVELACEKLKKKLCAIAAGMLSCSPAGGNDL